MRPREGLVSGTGGRPEENYWGSLEGEGAVVETIMGSEREGVATQGSGPSRGRGGLRCILKSRLRVDLPGPRTQTLGWKVFQTPEPWSLWGKDSRYPAQAGGAGIEVTQF